jgi:hypothetical protein
MTERATPTAMPRPEKRDGEPRHGGHVRTAAEGHAAGHDDLGGRPARQQRILGPLGVIHARVGDPEDDHGEREGEQRPPAQLRTAGHQCDREHAEDRAPNAPQIAVHVQHALAIDPAGEEP